MLTIEDGAISLTRGDTAYLSLDLTDANGEPFEGSEGDYKTFTVRERVGGTLLFAITETLDSAFKITPDMTKELEYGRYVYDIQVTLANGDVFTVVPKNTFKLTEEVTE